MPTHLAVQILQPVDVVVLEVVEGIAVACAAGPSLVVTLRYSASRRIERIRGSRAAFGACF